MTTPLDEVDGGCRSERGSRGRWAAIMLSISILISAPMLVMGEAEGAVDVWATETVDSEGTSGWYSSIAIDPEDRTHIVFGRYGGDTGADMMYSTNRNGIWETETVQSENDAGHDPAIAVDSEGNVHVAYRDQSEQELRFAKNDGSGWDIQVVDDLINPGFGTSMAIDSNDRPHIVYYSNFPGSLVYATNPSGQWTRTTLDTSLGIGMTSIAIDANDRIHISYFDSASNLVRYITNAEGGWTGEDVYTVGDGASVWTSMTIDSEGHAHISFYDPNGEDLKHATNELGLWTVEYIDTAGDVGAYNSIGIDPAGRIYVCYTESNNKDLRYARYDEEIWSIDVVEDLPDVGEYCSLAIDSGGRAHISYRDDTNDDLRYALGPSEVPFPPQNPMAYAGDGYVDLEWVPPLIDGGQEIVEYRAYKGVDYGDWILWLMGNTSVQGTSYRDTSVTNGERYHYLVTAVNAMGEGGSSALVSAMPATLPSEPTGLVAVAGDSEVCLTWDAPVDDGGSPIVKYTVLRGSPWGEWILWLNNYTSTGTSYTDTTVENGLTYFYIVRAWNEQGIGPPCLSVKATPVGPPGAPRDLIAEAGDRFVELTWDPPFDDGGGEVIGYEVFKGTPWGDWIIWASAGQTGQTSYNDTSVVNGIEYHYNVLAYNQAGDGPVSETRVITPLGAPATPQGLQAHVDGDVVQLNWSAPASDGGSDILGYRVHRRASTGELSILATVSMLGYSDDTAVAGMTYEYAVSAFNAYGEGARSVSMLVTITDGTLPSPPQDVRLTPGDSRIDLSWSPPSDPGSSPITGYAIYRGTQPDDLALMEVVVTTGHTDDTVVNGVGYYYTVRAVNAQGEGQGSPLVHGVPVSSAAPSAPVGLEAIPGDSYVNLTWGHPADSGDSPITNFKLYKGMDPSLLEPYATLGNVTSFIDIFASNGLTYHYGVSALSPSGEGAMSNIASATPLEDMRDPHSLLDTTLVHVRTAGPVSLTIEDGEGRITGLLSGSQVNQIPGAQAQSVDGQWTYVLPRGRYAVDVRGNGTGEHDLFAYYADEGRLHHFALMSIGTAPGDHYRVVLDPLDGIGYLCLDGSSTYTIEMGYEHQGDTSILRLEGIGIEEGSVHTFQVREWGGLEAEGGTPVLLLHDEDGDGDPDHVMSIGQGTTGDDVNDELSPDEGTEPTVIIISLAAVVIVIAFIANIYVRRRRRR